MYSARMHTRPKTTAFLVGLSIAAVTQAEDVTHRYRVPSGLTVTKVSESPSIYNPTAIDIDPDGRIWVAEAVNYRQRLKELLEKAGSPE